jgi:hypothetical protein
MAAVPGDWVGEAMLTARAAIERRYAAWLERRYPGTRWAVRSDEGDRPGSLEPTGTETGGSGVAVEQPDRRHIPADPPADRE